MQYNAYGLRARALYAARATPALGGGGEPRTLGRVIRFGQFRAGMRQGMDGGGSGRAVGRLVGGDGATHGARGGGARSPPWKGVWVSWLACADRVKERRGRGVRSAVVRTRSLNKGGCCVAGSERSPEVTLKRSKEAWGVVNDDDEHRRSRRRISMQQVLLGAMMRRKHGMHEWNVGCGDVVELV